MGTRPSTESLLPTVHSVCDKKRNGGGSPFHIYSQKKNHKETAQSTDDEQALCYGLGIYYVERSHVDLFVYYRS